MRDITENRRVNLRKWIDKHHNGVQASFMEKTEINQGELSGLLSKKSFGEKKARSLEEVAGMPFLYLDKDPTDNVIPTITKGLIPLISWVAAGSWSTVECRDLDNVVEKWMPCPEKHSSDTFALTVVGLSMYNPNGELSFKEGDIIFVDPNVEPENKSCVIAFDNDSQTTTFKQLIIDENGNKFLVPLNPMWPDKIIPINGNTNIAGVIIGKWVSMK